MELERLYQRVFIICVDFAVYHKKNIVNSTRDLLQELQPFVQQFLNERIFELEEEDNRLLRQLLLDIMKDLLEGLEQQDMVLLEDTIEFGLKPFLELFFDEDELMQLREETANESGNL